MSETTEYTSTQKEKPDQKTVHNLLFHTAPLDAMNGIESVGLIGNPAMDTAGDKLFYSLNFHSEFNQKFGVDRKDKFVLTIWDRSAFAQTKNPDSSLKKTYGFKQFSPKHPAEQVSPEYYQNRGYGPIPGEKLKQVVPEHLLATLEINKQLKELLIIQKLCMAFNFSTRDIVAKSENRTGVGNFNFEAEERLLEQSLTKMCIDGDMEVTLGKGIDFKILAHDLVVHLAHEVLLEYVPSVLERISQESAKTTPDLDFISTLFSDLVTKQREVTDDISKRFLSIKISELKSFLKSKAINPTIKPDVHISLHRLDLNLNKLAGPYAVAEFYSTSKKYPQLFSLIH